MATTTFKAHPALQNQNVLLKIFRDLQDTLDSEGKDRQRLELARCARVCKAFNDPASRLLWAELPDLFPLLFLLKAFEAPPLSEEDDDDDIENNGMWTFVDDPAEAIRKAAARKPQFFTFNLNGEIDEESWARFRHYAPFVHVVASDPKPNRHEDNYEDDYVAIAPSVWEQISRRNDRQPLLPAIRHLEWEVDNPSNTELLYVVAPTLQRLRLHFHAVRRFSKKKWNTDMLLLLRTVISRTPLSKLSHLTITSKNVTVDELVRTVSLDVKHLNIRKLELGRGERHLAFPHDLLCKQAFSELTQLEELKLAVFWKNRVCIPPPMKHSTLRSLVVADHAGKPELFQLFATPNLRSLTVVHKTRVEIPSCRAMCAAIVRNLPTITAIHFQFYPETALVFAPRHEPLVPAIEPLFALQNIREASLDLFGSYVGMNNVDICSIVQRWPHLERLSLKHPWLQKADAPGIPTLLSVARSAKMQSLYLSDLYLSPTDLADALTEHGGANCPSLRVLQVECVANDLGDRLPEFCKLANTLFPNLDLKMCGVRDGEGTGERVDWEKVLLGITECREARE